MKKIRDYHLWEEDEYDPQAPSVHELYSRHKKRKHGQQDFKKQGYEEEEDF